MAAVLPLHNSNQLAHLWPPAACCHKPGENRLGGSECESCQGCNLSREQKPRVRSGHETTRFGKKRMGNRGLGCEAVGIWRRRAVLGVACGVWRAWHSPPPVCAPLPSPPALKWLTQQEADPRAECCS